MSLATFIKSFLARWTFRTKSLFFTTGRGNGTYWRALEWEGEVRLDNVWRCCDGNAIGIEAKSTKRVGRSEAGLEANSPGRRHRKIFFTK